MQKIEFIFAKKEKSSVLAFLQKRGDVEILNLNPEQEDFVINKEIEYTLAELDFVFDVLAKRAPAGKKGLAEKIKSFLAGSPETSLKKFSQTCASLHYQNYIAEIKKIDDQIIARENETKELEEKENFLAPWSGFNIESRDLETKSTKTITGKIKETKLASMREIVNGEVYIRKLKKIGQDYYLAITYLKNNEAKFYADLAIACFEIINLNLENIPARVLSQISARKQEIAGEKETLQSQLVNFKKEEAKLKMIFDYLTHQKELNSARKLSVDTLYVSFLRGWIEKARYPHLEKELKEIFPGIYLSCVKPEENEKPPVVIKNSKYIEPFESVTRVYGLPAYHELDPTPYLSVFFAIFFGMCLSDAGYGVVLLALSAIGVKFLKLAHDFKRLLSLMIYCSLTTIIVGILYGSYFSISLPDFPNSAFARALLSLQVIDPIKSPLQIMILALILGLVQIWFARIVNVKYLLSRKQYKKALLGDFIWVLAIIAIVFFGISKFFFPAYGKIAGYLLIAFAVILVLTQGYENRNIFLKFGKGLLSLYNIVGMLSDVLSYSRLLALGLTTSIIGFVVNVIALLFRDMIPYAGIVIMILILIAGHLFNIAINILGGFIHSARLQFVEFFPKFMEGGGRVFKPLKKEYKFTKIKAV